MPPNEWEFSAEPNSPLALVIGNGNYQKGPLKNPAHDATDISTKLKNLGFHVIAAINVEKSGMKKLINHFAQLLINKDAGLFFFAGHGMQVDGKNYLIPVDNSERVTKSNIEDKTVNATWVLEKMDESKCKLKIVILDACRDNPNERSFRGSSKGLGMLNSPAGTILAYSTAPGQLAEDGLGRNSTYTKYLLKYIDEPNLPVELFFKKVRIDVKEKTGGRQVPWESTSLTGDFSFNTNQTRGFAYVSIPSGYYSMGSPVEEPGRDTDEQLHEVEIKNGFEMLSTEVTVGQWRDFIKKTNYETDAETRDGCLAKTEGGWKRDKQYSWRDPGFSQSGVNQPVTCISLNDALRFVTWLNENDDENDYEYRLPTEEEWEYACRSGTKTPFSTGDCLTQANYNAQYPYEGCPKDKYVGYIKPVGSFDSNAWGLYDMHGNISEWCQNAHLKGGSWNSNANNCRSANRLSRDSDYCDSETGLRVVRIRK